MNTIPPSEMLLTMLAGLFILGLVTFTVGMIILITRILNHDIRRITQKTSQLVQKGLTDDIAGLVGNASALLTATSEMMRTSAGIGAFLLIIGLLIIAACIGVVFYLNMG